MSTTRRDFLVRSASLAALAAASCRSSPQDMPAKSRAIKGPLFKISLAEWSLHKALQAQRMTNLDFPLVARRDYGIDAVEYVNQFFKDKATDAAYLAELKMRCSDAGVESRLIMCDGEGSIGAADVKTRKEAVENHTKWLGAAHELGCHSIRLNAYGEGTREEHAARVAESLHELAVRGDKLGLNVIVENHGGLSSDGAWLAGVMKLADHSRVGTLPDFGNFKLGEGKEYDRYQGIAEMMPWAKAVSAKSYDFDAQGNETTIDYKRMMQIVLAAGYHEHMGIEYEGDRLSEPEGIRATKALLERLRGELA